MTEKKPTKKDEKKIPSIYEKLFNIMKGISHIEKDGNNTFQKYKYASEYAIKATLKHHLEKNRVLFNMSIENQGIIKPEGQDQIFTHIGVTYKFICVDTGESLQGWFQGQGADKGDKGLYKAITGTIKYILTSQFLIPTGDDPERSGIIKKELPNCPKCSKKMVRYADTYGCSSCKEKLPL